MAVDTRDKRSSAASFLGTPIFPDPDGAITSVADRMHIAGVYSGLAPTTVSGSVTETLNLTDSVTAVVKRTATVSDTLNLTDQASGVTDTVSSVEDSLTLTDTVSALGTLTGLVEDTLTLTDNLTVVSTFRSVITDSLILTDSVTAVLSFSETLTDTLVLTDSTDFVNLVNGVVISNYALITPKLGGLSLKSPKAGNPDLQIP
jgi:hypothetical protein